MREVVIAPQDGKKGRTFQATLLAFVEADLLWPGGETVRDNMRPVWAMFGGSDQELRAFMANLVLGRKATFPKRSNDYSRRKADCMEILKSSGYQVTWQREDEGSLATIFLPELFQIDPGMIDPNGIRFVVLPTQKWIGAQTIESVPLIRHAYRCGHSELTQDQLAGWAPLSFLFSAYLDRRTYCPLVADGRFYLQLMLACLQNGLATFTTAPNHYSHSAEFGENPKLRYYETEISTIGLSQGLAFRADHETLDKLLALEVEKFFKLTQGTH